MTDTTPAVRIEPGHVYVEVSGLTGSGKSAVMGEIEIALKALGLTVGHDAAFQAEKNGTHADWQEALDLYKPTVVLTERNVVDALAAAPVAPGEGVEPEVGAVASWKSAADWTDPSNLDRLYREYDDRRTTDPVSIHTARLHPKTTELVNSFAIALAHKLLAAEEKYGYSDGWLTDDWEAKCRADLLAHVHKGDPLDVAAYAAFCWARNWSTTPAAHPTPDDRLAVAVEALGDARGILDKIKAWTGDGRRNDETVGIFMRDLLSGRYRQTTGIELGAIRSASKSTAEALALLTKSGEAEG